MVPTLALSDIVVSLMVVGFVAVSILLILVVLIQRPQGGGLSGAFGAGAGSGQTAFGAKTGDALTFATVFMFVLFLVVAVGLGFATRPVEEADGSPAIVDTTTGEQPAETTPVEGEPSGETGDPVVEDGSAEPIEDAAGDPAEQPAEQPAPDGDTPTEEPTGAPETPGDGG